MALLAVALAGCRRTNEGGGASVRLGPAPVLTCKPNPCFRWLDALDHPYSDAFRRSFSYADAHAVVRFPREGPVFHGRVVARKLKPNFAYQIKLVGMPLFLWGKKGDAASNRRIGELGRWWKPGKDAHNAYFFDTDEDKSHMEGYLIFGYFVTDAQGNADATFRLDSSLHVLWKTSQWPPAKGDAKPTRHPIVAQAGRGGYDRSFPKGELEVYAEGQYGRPPLGKARLPAGRYRCFFLLTEESFHSWGGGIGGDWAAALAAPIEFAITSPEEEGQGARPDRAGKD